LSNLKNEIGQQRPFSSPAEEALLNLLRTADCLQRAMQLVARPWSITSTQYNVLRILRGVYPEGLPCSAIGDRMITADPDITRLLARLRNQKLIRQERGKKDKRVLTTYISDTGFALLNEMDETVSQFPKQMLGHLSADEVLELTRLLELARKNCADRQQASVCEQSADTPKCGADEPR
jgi:DNA-binding MarR family transcriptional regulator